MDLKNLTIIGTSHIAKQSLKEVEHTIKKINPAIIAVELDKGRAQALLSGVKSSLSLSDIKKIGVKGFIFAWLGAYAEKKLGKLVGMKPGDEMLKAIHLAQEHDSMIILIDQDIAVTLRRFSKFLTWREKARMVVDVFNAVVFKKSFVSFDLRTVPDKHTIKKMTRELGKRYPNIYRVLIAERNVVMAKNLFAIMKNYPEDTIVAVMGAGHVDEVKKMLKNALQNY